MVIYLRLGLDFEAKSLRFIAKSLIDVFLDSLNKIFAIFNCARPIFR